MPSRGRWLRASPLLPPPSSLLPLTSGAGRHRCPSSAVEQIERRIVEGVGCALAGQERHDRRHVFHDDLRKDHDQLLDVCHCADRVQLAKHCFQQVRHVRLDLRPGFHHHPGDQHACKDRRTFRGVRVEQPHDDLHDVPAHRSISTHHNARVSMYIGATRTRRRSGRPGSRARARVKRCSPSVSSSACQKQR